MKYFLYKSYDKAHLEIYKDIKSRYKYKVLMNGWSEFEINLDEYEFLMKFCVKSNNGTGMFWYENRKI